MRKDLFFYFCIKNHFVLFDFLENRIYVLSLLYKIFSLCLITSIFLITYGGKKIFLFQFGNGRKKNSTPLPELKKISHVLTEAMYSLPTTEEIILPFFLLMRFLSLCVIDYLSCFSEYKVIYLSVYLSFRPSACLFHLHLLSVCLSISWMSSVCLSAIHISI